MARLEAFESLTDGVAPEYRAVELVRAVRLCLEAGRPDIAERLVASGDPQVLRDRLRLETARALLAEAHSEPGAAEAFARVAERLRAYGAPFDEAMMLLGHARIIGDEDSRKRARELLDRLGVGLPVE